MSEELAIPARPIILPHTGTVIAPTDTEDCVNALVELRRIEDAVREVKRELSAAIAAEGARQGSKTLHLPDGRTAEIGGGTVVLWDAQALEDGLRALGMPEERIREIVKEEVTYTVNAREAKRAASANPAYAELIERCRHEQTRTPHVKVSEP